MGLNKVVYLIFVLKPFLKTFQQLEIEKLVLRFKKKNEFSSFFVPFLSNISNEEKKITQKEMDSAKNITRLTFWTIPRS